MINIVFLLLIFFLITSLLVSRPGGIIERPFGLSDSQVEDQIIYSLPVVLKLCIAVKLENLLGI